MNGRERLDGPLEGADRERRAAREHERPGGAPCAPVRPRDESEEEPEAGQHRDPGGHDQERMDSRRLLRLLRCESVVHDERALVEAEEHGGAVEGERAGEESGEAGVRRPP